MSQSLLEKKDKARWARIRRVYGITKEQYDELYSATSGCPLCLRPFDDAVRPCIDHDHQTGEIRGIICLYCNHRILGRHRDSLLLRRMVGYLEEPRRGWIVPKKKRRRRKAIKRKSH